MKTSRVVALIGLVASLAPSAARAEWPAAGKRVLLTTDSFNLTSSVWISDLASGDLLVRGVGVGGNANGYDVQRISPLGDIATGWPERGASFGQFGKTIREWAIGFTSDDAGFSWFEEMTGSFSNIVGARLIDPTAALAPAGARSEEHTSELQSLR